MCNETLRKEKQLANERFRVQQFVVKTGYWDKSDILNRYVTFVPIKSGIQYLAKYWDKNDIKSEIKNAEGTQMTRRGKIWGHF